jgi:hypothetical protein
MMSSPEEQQRQATLLELARELCAVIERDEITAEEGLEAPRGASRGAGLINNSPAPSAALEAARGR